MRVTVVISYYKALDNLKLILSGLSKQSSLDFEVVVSEDDANNETTQFIADNRSEYPFPIIHLNQPADIGFRKNMMLNKSIQASTTDFMIFIDGDCIPHKHFILEYAKHAAYGKILWGRRVMLGETTSNRIKSANIFKPLSWLQLFFSDSSKVKEGVYFPWFPLSFGKRGLKGCNWGVMKKHLIDLNGYDEDYIGPGVGEDNDIEWRLEASGLTKYSMKNRAIVYHLYHPRGYSDQGVKENFSMFLSKKEEGHISCINGLEKKKSSKSFSPISQIV